MIDSGIATHIMRGFTVSSELSYCIVTSIRGNELMPNVFVVGSGIRINCLLDTGAQVSTIAVVLQ